MRGWGCMHNDRHAGPQKAIKSYIARLQQVAALPSERPIVTKRLPS